MYIQKTNRSVIAAYLVISVLNLGSFIQFDRMRGIQQQAIEKQRAATIEAERMIAGSKSLTNSVRAFAATGDTQHEKAYWDEVKFVMSRDKAEAALHEMGLTDGEIALIEKAKGNSDKLIELEDLAFKVGAQGNRTRAIELVFGEDYRKALATIYTPVEQFRMRLDKRLLAEVDAAERQVQWWWTASLVLSLFNAGLVLFILGIFYRRRIVDPLARLNNSVQGMLVGDGKTGGVSSAFSSTRAATEIGELAKSIKVLEEAFLRAEDMRWIKTHAAEIGSALQLADDLKTLAQTAVSRIAPIIGAGHGALYVSDGANDFNLLGSYGYRERKHLNGSFAVGEGLVGQCAMERSPITLTAPKDYIRISSGLGEGEPACIVVLPIIRGERVLGVLEMASFQQFSERERALLDALQPILAAGLEILDRSLRTRELLAATQEQAARMEKQAAQLEEQSVEMEAQQAELLETENWFRGIIEALPDGMLIVDEGGQVVLANPSAEGLFGYAPGELMGCRIEALVPERVRSAHAGMRAMFMAENRSRRMGSGSRLTGLRKDGGEVPVVVALSPLPARGGRGRCVSVTVRHVETDSVTEG